MISSDVENRVTNTVLGTPVCVRLFSFSEELNCHVPNRVELG